LINANNPVNANPEFNVMYLCVFFGKGFFSRFSITDFWSGVRLIANCRLSSPFSGFSHLPNFLKHCEIFFPAPPAACGHPLAMPLPLPYLQDVVDGDFCELFTTLPYSKQREIAEQLDRRSGTLFDSLTSSRFYTNEFPVCRSFPHLLA